MVERVMSNVQLTFWAIFMRERNRRTVLQQVSTNNFVQQLFFSGKGSLSRRRVVQHKLHHIRTKQRLLSKRFPIIPRTEERNHINNPKCNLLLLNTL